MKKINKKLVPIMLTVFMAFSILGIGNFKKVFASTSSEKDTLQTAIPQNHQKDILFDALSFDLKVNETHRIIVLDTPRVGADDQGAILKAEKEVLNKDVTAEVVNVQIKALENAIKGLVEPKEEPSEPKGNAFIETKLVEIFPGEKFKLKITAEKGTYFIYKSEITGVSSGYKKIVDEIEFNIPKDAKPGEYNLTNLAVYDVDDKFEPNTPYSIRLQLLAGRLGENKVADLSDVKVVVKEAVKEQQVEIENITGQTEFVKGGEAEITVKATNISDKVQSANLIVGIFDSKGALINYVASSQNVKAKDNIKLTAKMKLPNEDGYTVKAFVCDGLKTMHPISRVIQIPVK